MLKFLLVFFLFQNSLANAEKSIQSFIESLPMVSPPPKNWSIDRVQEILNQGGDPNATTDEGRTLLHYATYYKDIYSVQLLVRRGADVNALDDNHFTPLMNTVKTYGEESSLLEIVLFLLEETNVKLELTDKNKQMTAFHWAVWKQRNSLAKAIGKKMFQKTGSWNFINASNINGKTALHLAAEDSNTDMLSWLIHQGADVNLRDKSFATPLYAFIENIDEDEDEEENNIEIITTLLSAGANPNISNITGRSLLALAIENLDLEREYEEEYDDNRYEGDNEILIALHQGGAKLSSPGSEDYYNPGNHYYNHTRLLVEKKCKEEEEQSFVEDIFTAIEPGLDNCKDLSELMSQWDQNFFWIQSLRNSLHYEVNDYALGINAFSGQITLKDNPNLIIQTDSIAFDCPFCHLNAINITIAGSSFFFLCKGSDEDSECGQTIRRWKQNLKKGYKMKIQFHRVFIPFLSGELWPTFYYLEISYVEFI